MKVIKTTGELNALIPDTLMGNLGISYLSVEFGHIIAEMVVDERTSQPFGRLHGGAVLALAESVAGAGSFAFINEKEWMVLGTEISASHVAAASFGKVIAEAKLIFEGKIHHVWDIKVKTEAGKLISVIRITNTLIPVR